MDQKEVGRRLKKIRQHLGLNQKEFCEKFSITNQQRLSNYETGANGIPDGLKLALREDGINIDWLLSGEGDMLGKAVVVEKDGVPYYDFDVVAQVSDPLEVLETQPEYFVDFQPFNDCTAFLSVYGDSMFPAIKAGDIIAVKKIENVDVILWGEAHFIITNAESNNLKIVKLIFPHADQDKVILRASNPNFKGDTVIDKRSIKELYIVKGIVSRKQM